MGNFHNNAFDNATLLKLNIYSRYITEWLPTFINSSSNAWWNGTINIFDFFSGPGRDKHGSDGSPILAIRQCLNFSEQLQANKQSVNLYFSESSKSKIENLRAVLGEWDLPKFINASVSRAEFSEEFERQIPVMRGAANLIFIDQCGMKEVGEETFEILRSLKGTDFIFFIASSFVQRFGGSKEFQKYLNVEHKFKKDIPSAFAHRIIADAYREMIPAAEEYYLASFSLKKGRNINGLVFGSGHLRGLEKFINICWDIDELRGESNFDIDQDNIPIGEKNFDMFQSEFKSSKLAKFEEEVEKMLLNSEFASDAHLFRYALESGFKPAKHAKPILRKLIKEKLITCQGQPRLSKSSLSEPRRITRC